MWKPSLFLEHFLGLAVEQLFHPDRQFNFDWLSKAVRDEIRQQNLVIQSNDLSLDTNYNGVLHELRTECRNTL